MLRMLLIFQLYISLIYSFESSVWLVREALNYAFDEFNKTMVKNRRSSSLPFITGDLFRNNCPELCDSGNRCRMWPDRVKEKGTCIFVQGDMYGFFQTNVTNRINAPYVVVSHNGDISTPDWQNDAPATRFDKHLRFHTSKILEDEYSKGRLIAHHGSNLWWRKIDDDDKGKGGTKNPSDKPEYLHCLPIGIENRYNPIGRDPGRYIRAMRKYVLEANSTINNDNDNEKIHLLIAFSAKGRAPDRARALKALFATFGTPKALKSSTTTSIPNDTTTTTTTSTATNTTISFNPRLPHDKWLEAITKHRFVVAPHGHGLDTHRMMEILLMGGIPIIKQSSISSCYDDSDNILFRPDGKTLTRGSIPVVVVDSWSDVTSERLQKEWKRIISTPRHDWDWSRLFASHWLERIAFHKDR